jgi:hypothetical protein
MDLRACDLLLATDSSTSTCTGSSTSTCTGTSTSITLDPRHASGKYCNGACADV